MIISQIISTALGILIGWLLIDKVPTWIGVSGIIATIIKIVGVIIIISALLALI